MIVKSAPAPASAMLACDCCPSGAGVVMAKRQPNGDVVILKRSHGATHFLTLHLDRIARRG